MLRVFCSSYPAGKYFLEAHNRLADLEYESVRSSTDSAALRRFAHDYPEHQFARVGAAIARQLDAREAATQEIRQTLSRYASAVQDMKVEEVSAWRELSRKQQESFASMFRAARHIEVTLTPEGLPEFPEPVTSDPTSWDRIPGEATIPAQLKMKIDSGRGDVQSVQQELKIHVRRHEAVWIITAL